MHAEICSEVKNYGSQTSTCNACVSETMMKSVLLRWAPSLNDGRDIVQILKVDLAHQLDLA